VREGYRREMVQWGEGRFGRQRDVVGVEGWY
jgi:hypothetical protein